MTVVEAQRKASSSTQEVPRATRPRRSRRRTVRRVLITVVVLAGVLLGADFGFAAYAEYHVSQMLRQQLHVTDDPRVAVRGFPFTTQALAGDYQDITVDADGVPVKNTLRDLEFHAELRHVRVPIDQLVSGKVQRVPVDQLNGSVKISASDIGRMLHLPDMRLIPQPISAVLSPTNTPSEDIDKEKGIDRTRGGTVAGFQLVTTTTIVGQPTRVTVSGLISLVNGHIQASPKKLTLNNAFVSGTLPEPLQSQLLRKFVFRVDPGSLPFEVHPTGVGVEDGALSVTGTANHLVLSGSGAPWNSQR